MSSPPISGGVEEARRLPPDAARACEALVVGGERHLRDHGPFTARVVDVRRRAHSVIHVISLSNGRRARRFYLKRLNTNPSVHDRKLRECVTEYRLLEELTHRFASFADLGVIRPIACWPEDLAFLTEEFPGQNVELVLRDDVRRLWSPSALRRAAALCRKAGEWLRHFQSYTVPDVSTFDVDELIAYCDLRISTILDGAEGLLTRPLSQVVMRHVTNLAATFSESERELVGRHNDLRPDNMLTRDERLVVVDFTGFTYGPRLYDYMKFWMRLDYMAFGALPIGRRVEALKAGFAEGYGRAVDLDAPMAQFLRIANILDKMSELADPPSRPLHRRLVDRRWHRHLLRQLRCSVAGRP